MYYAYVFNQAIIGYGESKEDALKDGQRRFKPFHDEHTVESIEARDMRSCEGPKFAEMSEQLYFEIQKKDFFGSYTTYENTRGLLRVQTNEESDPYDFMFQDELNKPKPKPTKRKRGRPTLIDGIAPCLHAYILELRNKRLLTCRQIAEKLEHENISDLKNNRLNPRQISRIVKNS
tara:strand:+ start:1424 stop:1951 length:528 start_codon:yes stop_codon:yes gene_type:complete